MLLIDIYTIPVAVFLALGASVLTLSIIASLIKSRRDEKEKVRERTKA